jgi:hypothetical protein
MSLYICGDIEWTTSDPDHGGAYLIKCDGTKTIVIAEMFKQMGEWVYDDGCHCHSTLGDSDYGLISRSACSISVPEYKG